MASNGVGGYKSCAACWLPKPLNESDAPRGHFRSQARASSRATKTRNAEAPMEAHGPLEADRTPSQRARTYCEEHADGPPLS